MREKIIEFDHGLFKFINQKWSNEAFDWFMPIATNKFTWIFLYVLILIYFIYQYRKFFFVPVIGLVLAVGASDYLTSGIMKDSFNRVRPCNVESLNANELVECRSSHSFPSSHAANHLAIAVFMLYMLRNRWVVLRGPFVLWALVIAYSRVYVGVHFPLDITVGGIIGIIFGILFGYSSKVLLTKFAPNYIK